MSHFVVIGQAEFVYDCGEISEIYELSMLNGFSEIMIPSNGEISDIALCNNAGDIDNPHWLAINVDPHFDYSLEINFSSCSAGMTILAAGQVAIYESCDLSSEALFCYTLTEEGSVTVPVEIFQSDITYYVLIDGYAGAFCQVDLTVEKHLPMESITDWYHSVGGFGGSDTYWYRDIGDTIINGLEYRTIDVFPEPDFPYNRFLRENLDTKKVYAYNIFSEEEYLLYDFSASIGDDLFIGNVGTFTVVGIDEVESKYGSLTRWELNGPGPSIFVIEGIGSADLFLANTASDPVFELLCAYHESDKIFGNENCMPPPRWAVNDSLITAEICEGESYLFGGIDYQESGTYVDSLINSEGIDSIVTLELNVLPIGISNIEEVLCEGESILINGTIFDELSPNGNIIIPNGSANGCDSIINVDISFLPIIIENYEATICEGSFEIWAEDTIATAGDYTFNLISSWGCDSIINLSVEVIDDIINATEITACEGETIIVDGNEITESGVYQTEYEASTGCDSVVVFNVTFLETSTFEDTLSYCPDEPIIIDGNLLPAGVYEFINQDQNGCDSISIITIVELSESDPECLSSIYDFESLNLVLSPNPFDSFIHLSSEEQIKSIDIWSITGRHRDYINSINQKEYLYDSSLIPAGVYLLTIRSENKIAIKKIIKY